MNEPKTIIGLPDVETFECLMYALYFLPPEATNKVFTIYQEDIINQLNIDPSTL